MTNGADCFVVDATYPSTPPLPHACLYDRIPDIALGEEKNGLLSSVRRDPRLCFNCGSPDHAVASCLEPINREVVSLSRQLFQFFHPDHPAQETVRFYVAEGRRQQRLEWLESYEPGMIRGAQLRDALGLQDGDPGNMTEWLRNMAYWGYPPGWVGFRNPRRLVCSRIRDEAASDVTPSEWKPFAIFKGTDDDEEVDLALFDLGQFAISSPATSLSTASADHGSPSRWATYPNTYFSSAALSVYDGTPLGSVALSPLPRVSATFTPERSALWARIVSGGLRGDNIPSVPPWRLPGAFCALSMEGIKSVAPPPPSITPPPLPHTQNTSAFSSTDDRSVVDMDLSNDSE